MESPKGFERCSTLTTVDLTQQGWKQQQRKYKEEEENTSRWSEQAQQ